MPQKVSKVLALHNFVWWRWQAEADAVQECGAELVRLWLLLVLSLVTVVGTAVVVIVLVVVTAAAVAAVIVGQYGCS